MRILLIALGMLISVTAAQAQLLGGSDTPERIAQIRSHCGHQPDPAACHQYLDGYSGWRKEMDYLERSLNSGFTNPGGGRSVAPPVQYRYYQAPVMVVRRPPPPPMLCWTPRGYIPCR